MDDAEGGGAQPGDPTEDGTTSVGAPWRQHNPSGSWSSNGNHGRSDRSAKPKKAATATSAQLEAYNSLFSSDNKSYDKFFTITSAEPNRTLNRINTVKANKDLEQFIGGTPLNVRELRSGDIMVEVATFNQSDKIQKLKTLAGCRVEVRSNDRMNQCKGTIYYRNDPGFTDEEIKEAINDTCEVKVADIYRMKKKVDNNLVELPIYLLTFQSTLLPNFVKIGWTRCSTRTYIPRPRRCFSCSEYGHGIKTCRNAKVCMVCGEGCEDSDMPHPNPCKSAPKCPNCNGPHAASSKECPRYIKEQLVLTTQANEGLTYQAARRKIFKDHATRIPKSRSSYAETTAHTNQKHTETPEISPSPVIQTNKFKNSTFNHLSNKAENDNENNRKRHLSDKSNPDSKKPSNPDPNKHHNKQKNQKTPVSKRK